MQNSKRFILVILITTVSPLVIGTKGSLDFEEGWLTAEPLSFTLNDLLDEDLIRNPKDVVHNEHEYKEKLLQLYLNERERENNSRHKIMRRGVHNEDYKAKLTEELYKKNPDQTSDGVPLDRAGDSPDDPLAWLNENVVEHNKLRKRHDSRELELDYKLAYLAKLWSDHLAEESGKQNKPVLVHFTGYEGENIAGKMHSSKAHLHSLDGGYGARLWYKEIKKHNWDKNMFQISSGHFTQVIWGATKRIGCGKTISSNSVLIVVCRYSPPGNYLNKNAFRDHCRPPNEGGPNEIPDFSTLNSEGMK